MRVENSPWSAFDSPEFGGLVLNLGAEATDKYLAALQSGEASADGWGMTWHLRIFFSRDMSELSRTQLEVRPAHTHIFKLFTRIAFINPSYA